MEAVDSEAKDVQAREWHRRSVPTILVHSGPETPAHRNPALTSRMPSMTEQQWFHGVISRDLAESRLQAYQEAEETGHFLVRRSLNKQGLLVLTVQYPDKIHHNVINRVGPGYQYMNFGICFASPVFLVEYYQSRPDYHGRTLGRGLRRPSDQIPRPDDHEF